MKKQKNFFVRDTYGPQYGEVVLIMSVLTIVLVRIFLSLTGYPQVGNESLHIAHMLWGGLLMILSIVFLLNFVNSEIRWLSAFVGGIGFGLFIDELGKFLTSDNNYFFEPTFAIMYGIFLILFFLIKYMQGHTNYRQDEIEISKKLQDISPYKTDTYIYSTYTKITGKIDALLENIVESNWFIILVITYFVINAVISILIYLGTYIDIELYHPKFMITTPNIIEISATVGFTILTIIGSYKLIRRERVKAFIYFRYAVYLSIFVLQFFSFLHGQLSALFGLGLSIIILMSLNHFIEKNQVN